jgi:hypothetical protein
MMIFVQFSAPSRKESSARPTSRERQATADRSCDHGASDDRPWTATREAPPEDRDGHRDDARRQPATIRRRPRGSVS